MKQAKEDSYLMICKLCDKVYSESLTFKTLFQMRILCPECMTQFQPKYASEVFPFDGGVVEYYSVFETENNDPKKKRILYRLMKSYFKEFMSDDSNDGLILLIEDTEFTNFSSWFPSLSGFSPLRLYSLFYYDWSYYEDSVWF